MTRTEVEIARHELCLSLLESECNLLFGELRLLTYDPPDFGIGSLSARKCSMDKMG